MGTLQEKLDYIAGTKSAIKRALIDKGATVADADTFRSYAEKVNGMAVDSTPNQTLTMTNTTESTTVSPGYTYLQLSVINLKGVTDIPKKAFYDAYSTYKPWGKLTTVVGDSVKTIGHDAFYSCTSLASVSLPAVKTIEDHAFYSCTSLASVSLPAVKTIEDHAFCNCTSLASVSLPAVETIEDYAFYNCTSLASVSIGSSITTIGSTSFSVCPALRTIEINRKSGAVSGSPWRATYATVSWTGTA